MRSARPDAGRELAQRKNPWFLLRFEAGIPPKEFFTVRIAWPAYAWRVIVPSPAQDDTDALQRAVTKLATAGKADPFEIGRLLGIDLVLAKRVLEERRGAGATGGQFSGQSPSNVDPLAYGWIFRDAVSGDVIPVFFAGPLPGAPVSACDEVIPLPFDGDNGARPSIENVTYALQYYRRITKRFPETDMDRRWLLADQSDPEDLYAVEWQDVDDTQEQDTGNEPAKLPQSVRIVSPKPEAVDIETFLYVSPDNPSKWYVRAPWRPFEGGWFRKRLEWAIGHSRDLSEQLAGWMAKARERFSAISAKLDECEVRVADNFPVISARPELHIVRDTLVQAYRAERLFEEDTSNLDIVLVRYCRSLELLLRTCILGLQDREGVIEKLGKYDFRNKIRNIACYFAVKLPRPMASDEMERKIRFVARSGCGVLRSQATFLLVHAYYTEDSPFRAVLRDRRDILELIDHVANLRNKLGGHYDPDSEIMDETELVRTVGSAAKTVLEVVSSHFWGR